MTNSEFQALMTQHHKLISESVVLKIELLRKIRQMHEFNYRAKQVLSQSHHILRTKVAILPCQ